eukprot:g6933.t1
MVDFSPGWTAAWLPSYFSGTAEFLEIALLFAVVFFIGAAFAEAFDQGMALLLPSPPPDEKTSADGASVKEAPKAKELDNCEEDAEPRPRPATPSWRVRARVALDSYSAHSLIYFLHAFAVFGGMNLHLLNLHLVLGVEIPSSFLRLCGSILLVATVYDFGRGTTFKGKKFLDAVNTLLHLHHLGALFAIWGNFYTCGYMISSAAEDVDVFATSSLVERTRKCQDAAWRDSVLITHFWAIHGLGFFLKKVLPTISFGLVPELAEYRSSAVDFGKHIYSAVTVYLLNGVLNHEDAFPYQGFAVVLMCAGRYGLAGTINFLRRVEIPGVLAVLFARMFGLGLDQAFGLVFAIAVCFFTHSVHAYDKKRKFTLASGLVNIGATGRAGGGGEASPSSAPEKAPAPAFFRFLFRGQEAAAEGGNVDASQDNRPSVAKFLAEVKGEVFPEEEGKVSKTLKESREQSKKHAKLFHDHLKDMKSGYPIPGNGATSEKGEEKQKDDEKKAPSDLLLSERWPLHLAALAGDFAKLEELLQERSIDEQCWDWGITPPLAMVLMVADLDEVAFWLLEQGANPYVEFNWENVAEDKKDQASPLGPSWKELKEKDQSMYLPWVGWAPIDIAFQLRKNDFEKGRLGACEDFWKRYHQVALESCGLNADDLVVQGPTPFWERVVAVAKAL